MRLFTEVLERAYADIIESYIDEKIIYLAEKVDSGYADVNSKIVTTKGEEYSINYTAQLVGSEWKVYDVVAENISLSQQLSFPVQPRDCQILLRRSGAPPQRQERIRRRAEKISVTCVLATFSQLRIAHRSSMRDD